MRSEDRETLWSSNPQNSSSRGRAIASGAANLMKNWPNRGDLLAAIFAGCVLSTALFLLALMPIIIAYSPSSSCRLMRKGPYRGDGGKSANVYFLKHENRTWTSKELCNIETAARRYPEYNIFLINLERKRNPSEREVVRAKFFNPLLEYYMPSRDNKPEPESNPESLMRYELSAISNILNVDISVENFFAGSLMSKKIDKLNRDKIELAAKFQAIWDSPGVALDPLNVHQLESVRHLFNSSKADLVAGVQIDSDLQASSIACQSFVGLVIREMAKSNVPERQTVLKHALVDFCSSLTECSGVQVIQPIAKRPRNFTNCPIVKSIIDAGNVAGDKNVMLSV